LTAVNLSSFLYDMAQRDELYKTQFYIIYSYVVCTMRINGTS